MTSLIHYMFLPITFLFSTLEDWFITGYTTVKHGVKLVLGLPEEKGFTRIARDIDSIKDKAEEIVGDLDKL